MSNIGLNIGDLVLGDKYRLLQQVQGSLGGSRQCIGNKDVCRYCGCREQGRFRTEAHTFPEALGNKWVFSNDECDECNGIFSRYESALADSVSPFLTIGGVNGKGKKTRQTGRTIGDRVLTHSVVDEKRGISVRLNGFEPEEIIREITPSGLLRFLIPVAGVPFVPRRAYKALAKMGFALLPDEELNNYLNLRQWLQNDNDDSGNSKFDVAMSFASIGNAPPLVAGCLLKRVDLSDNRIPHLLFIFCAGSICLQIDLTPDDIDNPLPSISVVRINWVTVVGNPETGDTIRFDYGEPVHRKWSSPQTESQPIESFMLEFNSVTCEGTLTPKFRH